MRIPGKTGYLHGFTPREQARLVKQARFLARWVYDGVDLSRCRRLLEVGCGVGAQTQILLSKYPKLHVTGVDRAPEQLRAAAARLKGFSRAGRVALVEADATRMPVPARAFDGAFVCWFLEHVPHPALVLAEIRRKLERGAPIVCTEVNNATLFLDPYSPATLKYWFEFNDYQWTIQGHPFVGAQLGNLLHEAGYRKIETVVQPLHFDSRTPRERRAFIAYWTELLLSAAPGLLASRRVSPRLVRAMKLELSRLARTKGSVFYYSFMRATAEA
ncbi:MAG: methyltransferase domain-containing protein [Planctomycetes bacterium]|nr:methyltransferase domain-containing protein [Planctomycetota bacterium]